MVRPPGGEFAGHFGPVHPPNDRDLGRELQLAIVKASVLRDEALAPRCGEYRLEQRVGAGGMGVVFRGRATDGGAVAVKVLARSAPAARARFTREAETLRTIEHPRIVRYLSHGETPDLAYLVMEWLEGRDLARRLAESTLSSAQALSVALELARALAAMHEIGILHRDLKPSNVFLVDDSLDDVRLIDFGVAKRDGPERPTSGLTATGALLGSPHYMAPEQLRGEHEPRSDVYGLGATLFEMLAGHPPFSGANLAAVLVAVSAEPAPSLGAVRADLAGPVDALVRRMLAKSPRERPRDMSAVVAELSDLVTRPWSEGIISHLERPRIRRAREWFPEPDGASCRPLGRARELYAARGVVESTLEADVAAALSISGEPGVGKSHLLRAILIGAPGWCSDLGRSLHVLSVAASEDERGVPFSTLRALLRIDQTAPRGEGAAISDTLRRLIDEQTSGRARDPRLLADQLQLAWQDLVQAWLGEGPLLLVIDDAHNADSTSLRYLARAAGLGGVQRDAPGGLVLVFASRDDTHVRENLRQHPGLEIVRVVLESLPIRICEDLAAQHLKHQRVATAAEVAALSGGNAAHLFALCREAKEHRDLAVGSLSDRLWDRVLALEPDVRRVLRAAAIVGRVFWRGAIAALLADLDPERIDAALARLRDEKLIVDRTEARLADEQESELESEIVHRIAYGLSTEEQLTRAHRLVAEYLAASERGASPALIGDHFARAGDGHAATEHFLRAARAALSGEDPESFAYACDLALRHAESADQRVEIAELRSSHAFWAGDLEVAVDLLRVAQSEVVVGSRQAFRLMSLLLTALGQRGDNDDVERLMRELEATPPHNDEAQSARIVALCRGLTQLETSGRDVALVRRRIDAIEEAKLDAEARLWRLRTRGNRAAQRSFDEAIGIYTDVHRHHVQAGDERSAAQIGCYLGSFSVWAGDWERASEYTEGALRAARRLGAEYLETWALYTRCKLLVETEPSEQTARLLDEVIARTTRSPRMRGGALTYAAIHALRVGRARRASELAAHALEVTTGPNFGAIGALARSLLALGRPEEASDALARTSAPRHLLTEFDELLRLARVEVAKARSMTDAASLFADARDTILRRAATLADPLRRNMYLGRPHLVVATLSLGS